MALIIFGPTSSAQKVRVHPTKVAGNDAVDTRGALFQLVEQRSDSPCHEAQRGFGSQKSLGGSCLLRRLPVKIEEAAGVGG